MGEWVEDAAAAAKYAQTFSPKGYPLTVPPHWLRCNFMRDGVRCCKGEGHHRSGEHKEHEEPKA